MTPDTLIWLTGSVSLLAWVIYTALIGLFTFGWYKKNGLAAGSWRSAACPEDEVRRIADPRLAISVIVAARNEEAHISDLLEDLLQQDYPPELTEIIVVDDHSTDITVDKVKEFIANSKGTGFRLVKFDDPQLSGKKAAITFGIKEASGEIILTTDGDCRVGRSWISSMVEAMGGRQMIFGPVTYTARAGWINQFQTLEFLGLVASGAGAAKAGYPFMCNGANLAYRKEAFNRVKGYEGNEAYISGDDVFLLHKMKKEYGRKAIAFSDDKNTLVVTAPAEGFAAFLMQRTRWASKTKGYSDLFSLATALIVFSYSFTVILSFFAGFFNPLMFYFSAGLIILKMITDLALMLGITGFTGQIGMMRWYLPIQAIYPIYIVIAGGISLFGRRKW